MSIHGLLCAAGMCSHHLAMSITRRQALPCGKLKYRSLSRYGAGITMISYCDYVSTVDIPCACSGESGIIVPASDI